MAATADLCLIVMCFTSEIFWHHPHHRSSNQHLKFITFPDTQYTKSTQTLADRAWKMTFHSKWVIFRVKLLIYQRVRSRTAAVTAESPHLTLLLLVLVDSPAEAAHTGSPPRAKIPYLYTAFELYTLPDLNY